MTSGQLRRSQSMENFINDIILEENIPESDIPTFQRRLCPGKTAIGQKFAFAYVDKGNRFKTVLYMDEQHRDLSVISKLFNKLDDSYYIPCCWGKECLFDSEKDTLTHMRMRCGQLKNNLKDEKIRTRERVIPKGMDPLKILQPGDYIRTSLALWGLINHDGIYVGRGQVIHVSNHSTSIFNAFRTKKASCARLGKLVPDFINTEDQQITILVYPIQFHTPETIVLNAIEYATQKFRLEEYHLKEKNCQHFGALCCTGVDRLQDKVVIRNALEMEESLSKNLSTMIGMHLSRRLGKKLETVTGVINEKIKKMLETGEKNQSPIINARWEEIYELIDLLKAAKIVPESTSKQESLNDPDPRSEELMKEALRKISEIRDRSSWIPLNNGIILQDGEPVNLNGGLCIHTIV